MAGDTTVRVESVDARTSLDMHAMREQGGADGNHL